MNKAMEQKRDSDAAARIFVSQKAWETYQSVCRGTTCFYYIRFVGISPCGKFILVKHIGHSEYISRCAPIEWCETWHGAYAVGQTVGYPADRFAIKVWSGRFTKSCVSEWESICGVR